MARIHAWLAVWRLLARTRCKVYEARKDLYATSVSLLCDMMYRKRLGVALKSLAVEI
jgi:hypothetical protein